MTREFSRIHGNIQSEHDEAEVYLFADAILNLPVEGPVVECGCVRGGFTAKLSVVCEHAGRKLCLFDSFEGLPEPTAFDGVYEFYESGTDVICQFGPTCHFQKGDYCASLEGLTRNVANEGSAAVCRFVKGVFRGTLPEYEMRPGMVLIDVQIIKSAAAASSTFSGSRGSVRTVAGRGSEPPNAASRR